MIAPGLSKPHQSSNAYCGDARAVIVYPQVWLLAAKVGPVHLRGSLPILPVFQRRMFSEGPYNEGTHHVHFTDYGSETWADPILFRDYLRAHPDVVTAYAQVKRAAATRHKNDLDGYHDEKAPFVASVTAQARASRAIGT